MAGALAASDPPARAARGGLRAALVRLHRYAGLALAGFLVVIGLTGSLLVFQRELDAALNPALWRAAQAGAPLSPGAIAARVAAADPRVEARWIPLDPRPTTAADVWVDWRDPAARAYDQVFVDPVTGAVNGARRYADACCLGAESFIPFVHRLHSTLLLPGRAGAFLLGGVALLWLIDSVNGLLLTLPRRRSTRGWGQSWRLKRGASPARRTFDLHRAGGLWLWGLAALMAVTSVALTLPHEVFEPVVERFSPIAGEPWEGRGPLPPGVQPIGFDRALAVARAAARRAGIAQAASGIYHAPEAALYGVRFGREEDAGVGQGWVYLASGDGALLHVAPATSGSAGDIVERVQLPLHAGRVGGLATRVLAALLGVAIAGLAVTGVLIWARKRRARAGPRARA